MISREKVTEIYAIFIMGPKPTPSKQNTLFSYFSKSPAVKNTAASQSEAQDVLSPKRSPNQLKKSSPQSKTENVCGEN